MRFAGLGCHAHFCTHTALSLARSLSLTCSLSRSLSRARSRALSLSLLLQACGGTHTCVLTQDGRIFSFGANAQGQCGVSGADYKLDLPQQVTGLLEGRRVMSIAAGGSVSAALVAPAHSSSSPSLSVSAAPLASSSPSSSPASGSWWRFW